MVDFTNWIIYAYFFITVGTIVILVYGIKFLFLLKDRKHPQPSAPDSVASEEELKAMLKDIQNQKKLQGKVKKAELKKVSSKVIKQQEVKEELEDTPIKAFSLLKTKSKLSWDYWRTWYLERYQAGRVVLINMELTNGFHKLFTVKEKEEGFVFRGKKYLFDDDFKYYNLDIKLYTFDYHEQIALPFKRKIPVTEIKKTMESTDEIDIEYAINPSTLQRFMTAKIAEGVMKGTQLDEFMKKLQTFLIVTMVAVLVHLALFLFASGMLQNIKVPGIVG